MTTVFSMLLLDYHPAVDRDGAFVHRDDEQLLKKQEKYYFNGHREKPQDI